MLELRQEVLEKFVETYNFHTHLLNITCERMMCSPSKKAGSGEKAKYELAKKTDSSELVGATIERIRDIVRYLNKDGFGNIESAIELQNFINHAAVMTECIYMLTKLFDADESIKNTKNHFNELGKDDKGSDDKYFKYIRSLISVHPVGTDRHPIYQDGQLEWCPYITGDYGKMYNIFIFKGRERPDYLARIYRSSGKDKYLWIYLKQLYSYIISRYEQLERITEKIEKLYEEKIAALKKEALKAASEFSDFMDYLTYLDSELVRRFGDNSFFDLDFYKVLFTRTYKNTKNQIALTSIINDFKSELKAVHHAAQAMNMEADIRLFPRKDKRKLSYSEAHYVLEKIKYLNNSNLGFKSIGNEEQFFEILSQDEVFQDILPRDISNDKWTNSEWARLMIKLIEKELRPDIILDYQLPDIDLYILVEIALLPDPDMIN